MFVTLKENTECVGLKRQVELLEGLVGELKSIGIGIIGKQDESDILFSLCRPVGPGSDSEWHKCTGEVGDLLYY